MPLQIFDVTAPQDCINKVCNVQKHHQASEKQQMMKEGMGSMLFEN